MGRGRRKAPGEGHLRNIIPLLLLPALVCPLDRGCRLEGPPRSDWACCARVASCALSCRTICSRHLNEANSRGARNYRGVSMLASDCVGLAEADCTEGQIGFKL